MPHNKIFSLYYHYLKSSTTGLDDQRLFDLVRTTSDKLGIPCPKRLDVTQVGGGKVFIRRISCADNAVQNLYKAVSATPDDFTRLNIENLQRVELVTQKSVRTPEPDSNSNARMSRDQPSLSCTTSRNFPKFAPSGGYPHTGPIPGVPNQRSAASSSRGSNPKRQLEEDEVEISSGNKKRRLALDGTQQQNRTDVSGSLGHVNLPVAGSPEPSAHKIRDSASKNSTQQEQIASLETRVKQEHSDELRARIRVLEDQLKEEQRKRMLYESIVENIRRETADPFVVPQLVDAFISISNIFSDINANEE